MFRWAEKAGKKARNAGKALERRMPSLDGHMHNDADALFADEFGSG